MFEHDTCSKWLEGKMVVNADHRLELTQEIATRTWAAIHGAHARMTRAVDQDYRAD
jgi:hypothetical protein